MGMQIPCNKTTDGVCMPHCPACTHDELISNAARMLHEINEACEARRQELGEMTSAGILEAEMKHQIHTHMHVGEGTLPRL